MRIVVTRRELDLILRALRYGGGPEREEAEALALSHRLALEEEQPAPKAKPDPYAEVGPDEPHRWCLRWRDGGAGFFATEEEANEAAARAKRHGERFRGPYRIAP